MTNKLLGGVYFVVRLQWCYSVKALNNVPCNV